MSFDIRFFSACLVFMATGLALALTYNLADEPTDNACPLRFVQSQLDFRGGKPGTGGKCVISPDGRHVYVGRYNQYRLLVYERNIGTGALELLQALECPFPAGLAISPDGKHLYVCGGGLTTAAKAYRRDAQTGKLTFLREYSVDEFQGVRGIADFAISDTGNQVYGVGGDAILVWDRNADSGTLEFVQAFQDNNAADFIEGTDIRRAPPIANAVIVDGLCGGHGVAISPDGGSIYVAGYGEQSIGVFSRDRKTGRLTFLEVFKETPGRLTYGVWLPTDADVSPDGRHVYVSTSSGHLVVFERDLSTGKLTWLERFDNEQNGVYGLEHANSVAVSPQGNNVFVASYGKEGAIARFRRDVKTGRLAFVGAVEDGDCGCATLRYSFWLAVSPDGRHLYNCSEEHTVGVFEIPSRAAGARED